MHVKAAALEAQIPQADVALGQINFTVTNFVHCLLIQAIFCSSIYKVHKENYNPNHSQGQRN